MATVICSSAIASSRVSVPRMLPASTWVFRCMTTMRLQRWPMSTKTWQVGRCSRAMAKTHLVVLRFDLSNDDAEFGGVGDRIRAYLDPVGTIEPASAAADISGIDFLADRIGAVTDFTFGDTKRASAIDEYRVGTTFADVANLQPAPEPTSIVLLGLGAAGAGLVVRRKRA